jgi:hypothetical protein
LEINELRIDFRKSIKKSIISELAEKTKYKLAKLNDCGGDVSPKREWYFYFYLLQPNGKYKRFIERFDINRKRGRNDDETRRMRYEYAKVVIKQINNTLTEGFFTNKKTDDSFEHMSVERAVMYAMEIKHSQNLFFVFS